MAAYSRRKLTTALVLCGAALASADCAPSGAFSPVLPHNPRNDHEAGFGASTSLDSNRDGPNLDGQFWYTTDFDETLTGGILVFTGQTSFTGMGGMLRETVVRTDRVSVAVEAQGGLAWAAAAVPITVRLSDALWLYSAPSGGLRRFAPFQIPVGLTFGSGDEYLVMVEASFKFDPNIFRTSNKEPFFYPQVGSGFGWKF